MYDMYQLEMNKLPLSPETKGNKYSKVAKMIKKREIIIIK